MHLHPQILTFNAQLMTEPGLELVYVAFSPWLSYELNPTQSRAMEVLNMVLVMPKLSQRLGAELSIQVSGVSLEAGYA